MIKNLKSQIIL